MSKRDRRLKEEHKRLSFEEAVASDLEHFKDWTAEDFREAKIETFASIIIKMLSLTKLQSRLDDAAIEEINDRVLNSLRQNGGVDELIAKATRSVRN